MRIIFVTNFKYPDSVAMATRIEMEALMLHREGVDVEIVGCDKEENTTNYRGIKVHHVKMSERFGIFKRNLRNKDLWKEIKRYIIQENSKEKIDCIVLSGFGSQFAVRLRRIGRKNNISLSVNETDWFQYHNFSSNWRRLYYYLRSEYSIRIVNVLYRNVIVISSYLEEYYKTKLCNVILFPTVIDFEKDYLNITPVEHDKIVLIYFGNAGKKDSLANVIRGIAQLPENIKNRFVLNVYGTSVDDLVKKQQLEQKVINSLVYKQVFFYPAIPHEEIYQKLRESDFSVLLRKNEKCANAGFPTKVAESMACGVPVICNYTSDLKNYVKTMESGVVADNEEPDAFTNCLLEIAQLNKQQIDEMRAYARETAEKAFDLNIYSKDFFCFFQRCMGERK